MTLLVATLTLLVATLTFHNKMLFNSCRVIFKTLRLYHTSPVSLFFLGSVVKGKLTIYACDFVKLRNDLTLEEKETIDKPEQVCPEQAE